MSTFRYNCWHKACISVVSPCLFPAKGKTLSQSSSKRVLISGASGFVGSALIPVLKEAGWQVSQLVRSKPNNDTQVHWDPQSGEVDLDAIAAADVVINLAGASIAGGWWTAKRKHLILQSRVETTGTLADAIAKSSSKPAVFISTSAVGYYGDRPDQILTEQSDNGEGFLANVCDLWEAAAQPARDAGVRVVHPRFGLVFDGSGGMLPLIKKPFQFGIGGKIGGDQYMSWIDLSDLLRVFPFVIENEKIDGPVNAVAPEPVTNAEFTTAMGKALHRPTVIPVPKPVASTLGGELARDLLLADQRVIPTVLQDAGFAFDYGTIDKSLQHAFGD